MIGWRRERHCGQVTRVHQSARGICSEQDDLSLAITASAAYKLLTTSLCLQIWQNIIHWFFQVFQTLWTFFSKSENLIEWITSAVISVHFWHKYIFREHGWRRYHVPSCALLRVSDCVTKNSIWYRRIPQIYFKFPEFSPSSPELANSLRFPCFPEL